MHSPRHSCGERKTQPSTPCSASMECGGKRSTDATARASDADFLRRPFFRSAGLPPDSGLTESSIGKEDTPPRRRVHGKLAGAYSHTVQKVFHNRGLPKRHKEFQI